MEGRHTSARGSEAWRVRCASERVHAAVARSGGERSWSCAEVNRSTTVIGPPHWGQRHRGWVVGAVEGSDWACGGTAWRAAKQSGKTVARLRLARKPKWRMRTKPLGSR